MCYELPVVLQVQKLSNIVDAFVSYKRYVTYMYYPGKDLLVKLLNLR